ncbi:MAG: hypothetical protein RL071_4350, partial [Pseudomonadota bacterium]
MTYYGRYDRYARPSPAQRQAKANAKRAQIIKAGRAPEPVTIAGRAIAQSVWGRAWCDNLEAYSDYQTRLPRGRTYARQGAVIDLQITGGHIEAQVSGSEIYTVRVDIDPLPEARWASIRAAASGQVGSMVDLLLGRLAEGVMAVVTQPHTGLFPAPKEIHLSCSCLDWATMCKHVAATLYGVGNRLDQRPELLFALRGVDPTALLAAALEATQALAPSAPGRALSGDGLSEIFGLDIDFGGGPSAAGAVAATVAAPAPAVGASAAKANPAAKPKPVVA